MSILLNEPSCNDCPTPPSYRSMLVIRNAEQTDRNLCRLAQAKMKESGYSELQSIRCECTDRVLKLTGKVSSFYLKQVAQEIIREIATNCLRVNQLDVEYPQSDTSNEGM